MEITRTSQLSGKVYTRDLDITEEQLAQFDAGMFVQDAFPHLSKSDREFILTGTTDEEWENLLPPDEEE